MYSKKLGNPLHNKVESIVAKKGAYGSVRHSDFDGIRNKSSVRAILTSMGFKPCNEARPFVWSLPKRRGQSEAKPKKEMKTKAGQEILDVLKTKGEFRISEFELSRRYLENIIGDIRELGYPVTSIKIGKSVEAYRLDKQ